MTSDDITSDDIRQMRHDGDLRAFLRAQIRRPEQRAFPAAAPPPTRDDGRPVGSWPPGTHPPGGPLPGHPSEGPTP